MEDLFIRAATLVAVGLATFSSFPGTAQQQDSPGQQQQRPASQQASPVPPVAPTATPQNSTEPSSGAGSGTAMSPAAAQLKPVTGELVDKLDSKSAKQGDNVVVKTDENLRISEGTEIPMGSKLIGHITNVQPRGDGKENSQIAIQFDRAELKDGRSLAIESVIRSVRPPVNEQANSGISTPSGPYAPSTGSSTLPSGTMGATPGAGTSANGSMNQNMGNGSAMQNMDNRPGMGSNNPAQAGRPGMNEPNATGSSMGQQGNPIPGSIVARNGNVAIRTTSVPGVLLANDVHGLPFSNASGLLLGARRDVQLDEGTKFVLGVAMAPQGAGSGMNR
jgi:hypothetical protein